MKGLIVMKKKSIDVVAIMVYIAMICLVLIVALPPILRLVMPKQTVAPVESHDKIEALICNKDMELSGQNITTRINVNYKNDNLVKMSYQYQLTDDTPADTAWDWQQIPEISDLSAIEGADIKQTEQDITLTFTKDVLDSREDAKYNNSLYDNQIALEEEGYYCQTLSQ